MLFVDDLAAAKRFYTEILDFSIAQEFEDRILLKYGSTEVIAFECDMPALQGKHGTESSCTMVLTVDDIKAKMQDMKALGVRFVHQTPVSSELGRYAAFYDPSGIVHELLQPEP